MEIKIDLDLPGIIATAVTAERIQPLVDKAIAEAIKDAISDATGYRSKFREELKKQLAEAMPHGLSIDDCAKFQQVLNKTFSEAVHGGNAQTVQAAMQAAMQAAAKSVIPDVPDRIKLSELVEAARSGFHKDSHEEFYAHLEINSWGGGTLYLDGNASCHGNHLADIRIAFNKEGDVYAMRLDGEDLTPKSLPTVIGSFEGLLLSMYVGRTSVELDCDGDDVASAAAEQYE
jgi:hypothetical protein